MEGRVWNITKLAAKAEVGCSFNNKHSHHLLPAKSFPAFQENDSISLPLNNTKQNRTTLAVPFIFYCSVCVGYSLCAITKSDRVL